MRLLEEYGKKTGPFTADYCGFGWILVKKGVYEKIPYPWFVPRVVQLEKTGWNYLRGCSV